MPTSKPKLPVVIDSTGKPSSKERQPFTSLSITVDQLKKEDGAVDPEALARILQLIQDNVKSSTLPARTHPLGQPVILRGIAMTSGTAVKLKHGLGESAGSWHCVRAYPNSNSFAAVEETYGDANWPSSLSNTQYLVLMPSCTGTYDLAVYPS